MIQINTLQIPFTKIQVYNEYDTLKEVVVGIADTLYFPDSHEIETEDKATFLSKMLSRFFSKTNGKKVPNWVAKKYQKEEDALIRVLRDYNVEVHRVDYVCPLDNEPFGLGQMYARDPVISVGDVILNSKLQISMRHKESRGFKTILKELNKNGITIKTPPTDDIYLEGGDVIINHPYIFVGYGKYGSNKKGIEWLKTITKGKFEVIPVEILDSSILHLDCSMTIIGTKKGIINRKSLESPLPFPLNEYTFYEVTDKTRKQLGTNVLMINPTTVIVQKRHKNLQKVLSKDGYKVIPVNFTWHTFLGGSFRCATCPLVRFENQVINTFKHSYNNFQIMNILIFKTDVDTKKRIKKVKPIFDSHPCIMDWSIDIEDIDNVLRIEFFNELKENDIITLLETSDFYCEIL